MRIECSYGGRWGLRTDLDIKQLRAVIDASLSLIKAGQVESAESLLNSFSSELAEVGPTVDMTWSSRDYDVDIS